MKFHFEYSSSVGPVVNFLSAVIPLTILVNACYYCTVQVELFHSFSFECIYFHFKIFQKIEFIMNIEKLTFWTGDNNQKFHSAKQELLSQINNLEISITGKGFFTVNRELMAEVKLGVSFECGVCSLLIFIIFFHV